MALKELIENQTIKIDDHKRGNREIKNWDNARSDIHIDKTTNFPLNGKRQKVRIKYLSIQTGLLALKMKDIKRSMRSQTD